MQIPKLTRVISAMFLVAGTIIGGGMLALPLATGLSGFWPAAAFMVACWLMMTITALMYLEVTLWMEPGEHVISMSSKILGRYGKAVAWLLYLFICYASIVAYTAGGGWQIIHGFNHLFQLDIGMGWGATLFVLLFGSVLYFGTAVVGRVNAVIFLGMIGAYLGLIGMGLNEVKAENLSYHNWQPGWLALPLILASFSFQTMVPSLPPYLNRHKKSLQWAIIGGTTISLIVYLLWQWIILGIVPVEGESGLMEAFTKGIPATQFVSEHVQGYHLALFAEAFAFFAIVTSFLGIALGLYDFLSDGLKIKEQGIGKIILVLLIAVPTLFFAINFERIFYVALDASGGYGDSILNGLIPVLLIWVGRYRYAYGEDKISWLEWKPLLAGVFIFFLVILIFKFSVDTGIVAF